MKDDKIKSNYIKKIKEINKYNENYYYKNNHLISDDKYDL